MLGTLDNPYGCPACRKAVGETRDENREPDLLGRHRVLRRDRDALLVLVVRGRRRGHACSECGPRAGHRWLPVLPVAAARASARGPPGGDRRGGRWMRRRVPDRIGL